jgi:hypothetical protein
VIARPAVIAIDHLAENPDHRARGPGGTALLAVSKDRHGGLRQHCPLLDREQVAGTFVLDPAEQNGAVRWRVLAPAPGERNPTERAAPEDIVAVAALDPPPESVEDARLRLKKSRVVVSMRCWARAAQECRRSRHRRRAG